MQGLGSDRWQNIETAVSNEVTLFIFYLLTLYVVEAKISGYSGYK
jgi:hypothetical protein